MISHKLKIENPNLKKFQFTFYSEKYRPVACIIETEKTFVDILRNQKDFYKLAVVKVCQKRSWTIKDFKGYGYGKFKFRKVG